MAAHRPLLPTHAHSAQRSWDQVPGPHMATPKFVAQVGNIYFLARIGSALRWATSDTAREELPPEIQRLLRKLDRLDAREARMPDERGEKS